VLTLSFPSNNKQQALFGLPSYNQKHLSIITAQMPSKNSKGAKRAVTKIIDALNGHDFKELQILVEKLQVRPSLTVSFCSYK
jgi:hypothetical protein